MFTFQDLEIPKKERKKHPQKIMKIVFQKQTKKNTYGCDLL